jgi:hypothetical protein
MVSPGNDSGLWLVILSLLLDYVVALGDIEVNVQVISIALDALVVAEEGLT